MRKKPESIVIGGWVSGGFSGCIYISKEIQVPVESKGFARKGRKMDIGYRQGVAVGEWSWF